MSNEHKAVMVMAEMVKKEEELQQRIAQLEEEIQLIIAGNQAEVNHYKIEIDALTDKCQAMAKVIDHIAKKVGEERDSIFCWERIDTIIAELDAAKRKRDYAEGNYDQLQQQHDQLQTMLFNERKKSAGLAAEVEQLRAKQNTYQAVMALTGATYDVDLCNKALAEFRAQAVASIKSSCNIYMAFPTDKKSAAEVVTLSDVNRYAELIRQQAKEK